MLYATTSHRQQAHVEFSAAADLCHTMLPGKSFHTRRQCQTRLFEAFEAQSALIRPSAEILHSPLPIPMFVNFSHQRRLQEGRAQRVIIHSGHHLLDRGFSLTVHSRCVLFLPRAFVPLP